MRITFPSDYTSRILTNLVVYDKTSQQTQSIKLHFNPNSSSSDIHFDVDTQNVKLFDCIVLLILVLVAFYMLSYCFSRTSSDSGYSPQEARRNFESQRTSYRDTSYRDSNNLRFFN